MQQSKIIAKEKFTVAVIYTLMCVTRLPKKQ